MRRTFANSKPSDKDSGFVGNNIRGDTRRDRLLRKKNGGKGKKSPSVVICSGGEGVCGDEYADPMTLPPFCSRVPGP